MSGIENDVFVGKNVNFDFTAAPPHLGIVTADGQLLIGSTTDPNNQIVANTLTAGAGISITNAPGSITIAASGGGTSIDSIGVQTGTSPVVPTGAGLVTMNGAVVAAGTNPVRTDGTGPNTLAVEVQISQALAAADATKIGLANFDSTDFTVSATGFVELSAAALVDLHTARFIVSAGGTADGANYTTIALALAAAGAGPATIFLQPGTYTTDFTLPANINLAAYNCDAETPNVSIVGKITCTDAGTRSISGIRLTTNSDFYLVVSGSAATIVKLVNCYVNCLNNTGISFTSSDGGAQIWLLGCDGTLGTTGITHWVSTSAGIINVQNSRLYSGSATSTASSTSTGQVIIQHSSLNFPLSTSSGGVYDLRYVVVACNNQNATALTTAGTGISNATFCEFLSGSASAISIGAGTSVFAQTCVITSSNTNAITGAGTLNFGNMEFQSSSVINTTTQTGQYTNLAKFKATAQPAFLAYNSANDDNVTGDGTTVTIDFDTEIFDQDSNFSADTFTSPVTGKVHFDACLLLQQVASVNTCQIDIVTSNRTYKYGNTGTSFVGNMPMALSVLADMDAGDTAFCQITVSGGTKIVDVYGASDQRTFFSGILLA